MDEGAMKIVTCAGCVNAFSFQCRPEQELIPGKNSDPCSPKVTSAIWIPNLREWQQASVGENPYDFWLCEVKKQ